VNRFFSEIALDHGEVLCSRESTTAFKAARANTVWLRP
jgi:hypothetical protein